MRMSTIALTMILIGLVSQARAETLTLSLTTQAGGTLSATATLSDADLATWLSWCQATYGASLTAAQCFAKFANDTFSQTARGVQRWQQNNLSGGITVTPNQ